MNSFGSVAELFVSAVVGVTKLSLGVKRKSCRPGSAPTRRRTRPMTALTQLLNQLVAFVPKLLGALLIVAVGYVVTRIITTLLKRLLQIVGHR